ncbi:hypothetical protein I5535_18675 [Rhodobacteraceae bacterium F11138]|nr:hypothetical protein [Rhodobacteraceae bacterium F11138]
MLAPEKIRAKLLQNYEPDLVCRPDSDLVIEGYPRSANTFTVSMIRVLCDAAGQKQPCIGHHTHSVQNLRLAAGYGIPMMVLIREPADAILSLHIRSGKSVETLLQRYVTFHTGLLDLDAAYLLARFDEVVGDFNTIITRLNTMLKTPLPLSADLAGDTTKAQARNKARAARKHNRQNIKQNINLRISTPTPEREKIKTALRAGIAQALADNPEPIRLYREVLARSA